MSMRASWALALGTCFALLLALCVMLWSLIDHSNTTINTLAAYADPIGAQQQRAFSEIATRYQFASIMILLAALLLIGLLLWVINRRIVLPLARIAASCDAMAYGDLSVPLERSNTSEIGQVWIAIDSLQKRLSRTVAIVRLSAQTVHRGAHRIASGNNSVSKRTEQQAERSRKTATRMKLLATTVNRHADQSRLANHMTTQAVRTANTHQASVKALGKHMRALQRHSKQISELVPALESIAAQNALLARNAMVEAALAGETGKGFALLASEMKQVSNRSAAAAEDIRQLAQETQKDSQIGMGHIEQAERQTEDLNHSAQQIHGVMYEATAAWQEQRHGVELLNSAIAQLDQLSQQHAQWVQTDAEAANQVEAEAERLKNAVAVFKLSPEAERRVSGREYDEVANWVSSLKPEDLEDGYGFGQRNARHKTR
jgi:methyl-accepting chemotaxis protein